MTFDATLTTTGNSAVIALVGRLDTDGDGLFREHVERAAQMELVELVLDMSELSQLSAAGIRMLAYARQQMADEVELVIASPPSGVRATLRAADFDDGVSIRE